MFELENLHLRLTSHCNKRCEHCFAALDNNSTELPLSYWIGIIRAAEIMNVKSITLTGGEPLLYHDISSLLQKIKDLKTPIKMETNGLLLEKYFDALIEIKSLKQIALSPGLHYEHKYMDNLLHRLLYFRKKELPIVIQASVIIGNMDEQLKWLEQFANEGIPVRLMAGHNGLGASKNLPNLSFDKMIEIGLRYASHPLIKCELPGTLIGQGRSKGCGWNRNRADILPNGQLTPCAAIAWNYSDFVLEYVDHNNLEDVWYNNSYLNRIRYLNREDFGGACASCDQFESCQSSCVATNLGLMHDLFSGYPLCTYNKCVEKKCNHE